MTMWLAASAGLSLIALLPLMVLCLATVAWRHRTRPWGGAVRPVVRSAALPAVVITLLVVTLRPGDIVPGDAHAINLEPFRDLRTSMESDHLVGIALMNLAGNVALFVPFGAVLGWVFPGSRIVAVAFAAIVVSALIEVAQSLPQVGRSSDITDVIMDTSGALFGFMAIRLSRRWMGGQLRPVGAGRGSGSQSDPPDVPQLVRSGK